MFKEIAPTSIERELRFGEWKKINGILIFISDLDDTICGTRSVFKKKMGEAVTHLADEAPFFTPNVWKGKVEVINDACFEKHGVNPNRWEMVVGQLAKEYGLSSNLKDSTIEIFAAIYETPLTMLDGAREGLDFLKKTGTPIGIVTHANVDWTWRKYKWLNLEAYVDWDDIYIVSENGHKNFESWQDGAKYYRLRPRQCAMVGDSPRTDVNAARRAGFGQCFLIDDPNQWSVHNEPVDLDVKKIPDLSKIPDAAYGEVFSF